MPDPSNETDEPEVPGNRSVSVMVRLTDAEADEIRKQAGDLSVEERRTVSLAEVLRRRAWGVLPVHSA